MMENEVDYEILYQVLLKENERLRMHITSLKTNGYRLRERFRDMPTHQKTYIATLILLVAPIVVQFILEKGFRHAK